MTSSRLYWLHREYSLYYLIEHKLSFWHLLHKRKKKKHLKMHIHHSNPWCQSHVMFFKKGMTLTNSQTPPPGDPCVHCAVGHSIRHSLVLLRLIALQLPLVVGEGAAGQHGGLWRVLAHLLQLHLIETHLSLERKMQFVSFSSIYFPIFTLMSHSNCRANIHA